MVSRSESKKRGCDNIEILETNSEKGNFGQDLVPVWNWIMMVENESDQSDPRKDEDWKIQRRTS